MRFRKFRGLVSDSESQRTRGFVMVTASTVSGWTIQLKAKLESTSSFGQVGDNTSEDPKRIAKAAPHPALAHCAPTALIACFAVATLPAAALPADTPRPYSQGSFLYRILRVVLIPKASISKSVGVLP